MTSTTLGYTYTLQGGGGAKGMAARQTTDMAAAMAAAQAERARLKELKAAGKHDANNGGKKSAKK